MESKRNSCTALQKHQTLIDREGINRPGWPLSSFPLCPRSSPRPLRAEDALWKEMVSHQGHWDTRITVSEGKKLTWVWTIGYQVRGPLCFLYETVLISKKEPSSHPPETCTAAGDLIPWFEACSTSPLRLTQGPRHFSESRHSSFRVQEVYLPWYHSTLFHFHYCFCLQHPSFRWHSSLEGIILSDTRRTQKDKYCMIVLIWGTWKSQTHWGRK